MNKLEAKRHSFGGYQEIREIIGTVAKLLLEILQDIRYSRNKGKSSSIAVTQFQILLMDDHLGNLLMLIT